MARTRKALSKQNLNRIPVLIEDRSQESVYFNIKQLNTYFTGGRNAFLITGTGLLEPNTEIFIEILDVNGNSMYLEAVKNFSEAGSRLVVIEVYENTPRGAATLTIVGTARQSVDGKLIPENLKRNVNVRWQKKLIIEPRTRNSSPIRIKRQPEIILNELLLTGSLLSQSAVNIPVSNITLKPKNVLNKQKGYIVLVNDGDTIAFKSSHLTPKITGSVTIQQRKYTGTIPATTETYEVLTSYTASLNLPLVHLNASKSFTETNIVDSNNNILNFTPLQNGTYEIVETLYTSSATEYTKTSKFIIGSIDYSYISQSTSLVTSSVLSFAKLRIINLDTVSGEIFRIKTSNKQAGSQTDFGFVADTPTIVGELLITSSADQDDREQAIGIFVNNTILTSSWYAHNITGSEIPDTSYADDTINASTHISLSKEDKYILDAAYAITATSSYFIGTRQEFALFPTSEYTLKFDSYVYTTSASYAFTASQYTLDVYLTGSSIVGNNIFGQKIGSISTKEKVGYFPNKKFNFTVPRSGSAGLRFVVSNGFWQLANVSLKVAEEYAFSPDEVTITIPNITQTTSSLVFKTDFFDINNNALDLNVQSIPTFFSGSSR
jgi:hypothetical protein